MNGKMNKAIAGYHMLMLLSNLDGDFSKPEGNLMIDYLREAFPHKTDLDNEIDFLSKLPRADYFNHFTKAMNDYYQDSTDHERATFIDFAVRMIKSDDNITKEENVFLDELMNTWDPDAAE